MSRLDIGRRVDEHVRPDTPALQGFAFARCCGFSSASIPHALTGKVGSGSRRFRPHAVAYDLWLPPAGSIRDLHPPPFIHARRTQSPYGLPPIPPRSLSLPTYSCVDPPPPSTLISRGEVSQGCWHRGLLLNGTGSEMIRIKGLDHVVIRAQDAKAMITFYCDVLGCVVERRSASEFGIVQLRAGDSH